MLSADNKMQKGHQDVFEERSAEGAWIEMPLFIAGQDLRPVDFAVLEGDAVIRTEDGFEFFVHRSILSACSRYFRVLFNTAMHRTPTVFQQLDGVSSNVMRIILTYCYTGVNPPMNYETVEDLLIACDRFFILSLKDSCCNFIVENITPRNCLGIWRFAKSYFCSQMATSAEKYATLNFRDVCLGEEFLDMLADELVTFLASDSLNIKKEEEVWNAIMMWVNYDVMSRKPFVAELLQCVRVGLLDPCYFMEKVKTYRHLDKASEPLMKETLKFLFGLDVSVTNSFPLSRPRKPSEILVTFGGWNGNQLTDSVEILKSGTNRWSQIDEMESGLPRATHGCAAISNKLFVIGGYIGIDSTNHCILYNNRRKTWTEVAPMHERRSRVSVAVVDGQIYACGGYNGSAVLNSCERFNPRLNQWSLLHNMGEKRSRSSAAATPDGRVFILGGFNGSETLRTCECFDSKTGIWSVITPMKEPREGLGGVYYNDCIYVFGGSDGIFMHKSAEVYSLSTGRWKLLPTMLRSRENFAVEVFCDHIYLIGGLTGTEISTSVDIYEVNQSRWSVSSSLAVGRTYLSAAVLRPLEDLQQNAMDDE